MRELIKPILTDQTKHQYGIMYTLLAQPGIDTLKNILNLVFPTEVEL